MSYYSDNIPMVKMPPTQFSSSSSSDIIEVTPPLPMSSQRFEPRSTSDGSHSFKRTRVPDNKQPPPKRRSGNIFFKTRLCTKFRFGSCKNGENCTFAHGVDEIRQPPPNWQELVGPCTEEQLRLGGNRNDDQKIIYKSPLQSALELSQKGTVIGRLRYVSGGKIVETAVFSTSVDVTGYRSVFCQIVALCSGVTGYTEA